MLCEYILYSLIQCVQSVIGSPSDSPLLSHFTFTILLILPIINRLLIVIPMKIDRFINSNPGALEIFAWDSLKRAAYFISPVPDRRRRPLLCNRAIWLTIPTCTLQIQNGWRRLNLAMRLAGRRRASRSRIIEYRRLQTRARLKDVGDSQGISICAAHTVLAYSGLHKAVQSVSIRAKSIRLHFGSGKMKYPQRPQRQIVPSSARIGTCDKTFNVSEMSARRWIARLSLCDDT